MGEYVYSLRGPSRARDIVIDGRVVRAGVASYDHKPFWGGPIPKGYEARVARTMKAWDGEAPEYVVLVDRDNGRIKPGCSVYELKHGLFSWGDDACHGHPDRMPLVGTIREMRRGKLPRVGTKRFDVTVRVRDFRVGDQPNPGILKAVSDVYERTERVHALNRADAIEATLEARRTTWGRYCVPEPGAWDAVELDSSSEAPAP